MIAQPASASDRSATARVSRRRLLRLGLGTTLILAANGLMAACNPASGPAQKPAPKTEAKPTEAPKPAAPAAQPAATAAAPQAAPAATAKRVQIEYWQYFFESKQKLVDELIAEFHQKNAGIEIVHNSTIPYEQYQQKLAASAPTGQSPHVVNLFYGWLGKYAQSGFIQPLPESAFSTATLEKDFFPVVQGAKLQGKYWGVPTAVRTLALFWNKDMYKAAGLDPERPPTTWDELVDHTVKTTTRGSDGKLEQAGFAWGPGGQGHHWWRECLNRQNGLQPMSEDYKKLNWTDPKGVEAFTWFTDLVTKHKVGEPGFYTDDSTAFKTGHAALHVDGSFRLSTLAKDSPNLNYGVAVLPQKVARASYASFWTNAITKQAQGETLDASVKWLEYLTSPEVMRRWTDAIGELPAKPAVANEEKFAKDPKLGPFIQQLGYSYATFFVDEAFDRQAVLDAVDQVILSKVEPASAVKEAADKVQKQLDEYWASVKA
jgi:multiple sugar transport system substrate-binding protein